MATNGGIAIGESQQVDDFLSRRKMFREQVRRVDFSPDLSQLDAGTLDALLNPEGTGVDVPELAQATSAKDADGGGGVGPYP